LGSLHATKTLCEGRYNDFSDSLRSRILRSWTSALRSSPKFAKKVVIITSAELVEILGFRAALGKEDERIWPRHRRGTVAIVGMS
jgi:hypothetical protein